MANHFTTLGVTESASSEEIKKAFRKLAMQYHPDRNKDAGSEDKFKEINEAYSILSDENKKKQYILSRQTKNNWTHKASASSYYDTSWNTSWDQHDDESLSDIFDRFRRQHQKSSKMYATITLKQAYTGVTIRDSGISLYVPPGTKPGSKFQLGNVLVEVNIAADAKFKRAENDLLVDVTIDVAEAVLGVDAIITHIDDTQLKFKIPEGIQPGQVIRLYGKGMPKLSSREFGDLLIRCSVKIPKNVGAAQKLFYKTIISGDVIKF